MFPAAQPKHDNAGGIAASVIVTLLLIGTMIAFLFFYLRTRRRDQAGTAPASSSLDAGFSNNSYDRELTVSSSDIHTSHLYDAYQLIIQMYCLNLLFVDLAILPLSNFKSQITTYAQYDTCNLFGFI